MSVAKKYYPKCMMAAVIVFVVAGGFARQGRDQLFVGARPIALGETFTAIANDGTAIFWNPAGLPQLRKYEFNYAYSNLFGIGLANTYVSFFAPISKRFGFGVDLLRLSFNDEQDGLGLDFEQNMFHLSLGVKALNSLMLGGNIKYLIMNSSEDQVKFGKATGTGYDFGILFSPATLFGRSFDKFKLGVMVHDLTDTDLSIENGPSETVYGQSIRFGLSYQPTPQITLGLDFDDRIHFGAEFWLLNTVALRAGFQKALHTAESAMFSFGLGMAAKVPGFELLQANYAHSLHPVLPGSNQFSGSITFDIFPETIKIVEVKIDNIYASLYKHYATNSIGEIIVKYNGKSSLPVQVEPIFSYSSAQQTSYLHQLTPTDSLISIPITVVFSSPILDEQQTAPLSGLLRLSYLTKGRQRYRFSRSDQFTLYARGMINWTKGVEQAAAFIDPIDEPVRILADTVLDIHASNSRTAIPGYDNINSAIQLFTAMGKIPIKYQSDPQYPYTKTYHGLDKIYYPVETLLQKRGDCDDTSILFAALLESQGISTALVAVPAHLLMMFDSGIQKSDHHDTIFNETNFILGKDGFYWIPVETTLLKNSFTEAWKAGVSSMRNNRPTIVYTSEAWPRYPFSSPQITSNVNYLVAGKNIVEYSVRSVEELRQKMENKIQEIESQLNQEIAELERIKKAATTFARWPWRGKWLAKATALYQRILEMSDSAADSFAVYNDRGNIYLLQEQARLDSALFMYNKALEIASRSNPRDTIGIYLNIGSLYMAAGDTANTDKYYFKVIKDSSDFQYVTEYLAIKIDGKEYDVPAGEKRISKKKRRKRTSKSKVRKKTRPFIVRQTQPDEDRESLKVTDLSKPIPGWEIEDVFYWALRTTKGSSGHVDKN